METAIVTGATAGIGKEVARKLAAKGYRVILACRNRAAAFEVKREFQAEIPDALVEVGPLLDLSSLESVRSFAAELGDQSISLLVNNAGLNVSPEHFSTDGVPLTVQVNYVGPYLLTRLLVPQLEGGNRRGKVVNVTSIMHRFGHITSPAELLSVGSQHDYANSKLALVMFSHEFRRRHGDAIDCCSVDPGGVRTKIFDSTLFAYPPFNWLIHATYAPPDDAAMTVMHAIEATPEPETQGSPVFARGLFAVHWVTHYPGYTSDRLGRALYVLVAVCCLLATLLDSHLRRYLAKGRCRETRVVSPVKSSLDSEACRALWHATESFLSW